MTKSHSALICRHDQHGVVNNPADHTTQSIKGAEFELSATADWIKCFTPVVFFLVVIEWGVLRAFENHRASVGITTLRNPKFQGLDINCDRGCWTGDVGQVDKALKPGLGQNDA